MRPSRLVPGAIVFVGVLSLLLVRPGAQASSRGSAVTKPFEFSVLEDYKKGEDLGGVARDFDLIGELGIRTWRGSLAWDDYEPAPGRYDFEWLHKFLTFAESRHMTLRPYIAYTPSWAAGGVDKDGQPWNQPPKEHAQWRAFVAAIAGELGHHKSVASLEIYNEENAAQRQRARRPVVFDDVRMVDRQIRRAGIKVLDWVPAGRHDLRHQSIRGRNGGIGIVDEEALHALPLPREGVALLRREGANL